MNGPYCSVYGLHSDYSLKDSPSKIKAVCTRLAQLGIKNAVLTDNNTCTGLLGFMSGAKSLGLNGIPGVKFRFNAVGQEEAYLTLTARDYEGFCQIAKAVSRAEKRKGELGREEACLTWNDLDIFRGGHTACTSGGTDGFLYSMLYYRETLTCRYKDVIEKWNGSSIEREEEALQKMKDNAAVLKRDIAGLKKDIEALSKADAGIQRKKAAAEAVKKEYEQLALDLEEEVARQKEKAKQDRITRKSKEEELSKKQKEAAGLAREIKTREKLLAEMKRTQAEYCEYLSMQISPEEIKFKTDHALQKMKEIFGAYFYIEVQNHGTKEEQRFMPEAVGIAKMYGIPLLASNDPHIITEADADAWQVMRSLKEERWVPLRKSDREYYIKTPDEIETALSALIGKEAAEESVRNTDLLLSGCHVEIPATPHYPKYPCEDGMTAQQTLRKKAYEGLAQRFPDGNYDKKKYTERIEYELNVIIELGFSDYILLVADMITYAKNYLKTHAPNGIGYGVGPGRGSGAGCLVNYALRITDIDPIPYGLKFERFLNKNRVTMPDIDTDYSDEVRDATIAYVAEKYGYDNVSFIRTAQTQGPKAAIKNCARVRGYELYGPAPKGSKEGSGHKTTQDLGDALSKLVPDKCTDIAECADDMLSAYPGDRNVKIILDRAMAVQNTITGFGIHAAGVIISDGTPLDSYVPLMYNDTKGMMAVQCDMVESEADLHLLKMDFLGLTNLSVITETLRRIYKNTGRKIDIENLPVEKEVLQSIYAEGNTYGVFQCESEGMRSVLRELKPESMEDIILAIAAYRPGPMDFIPDIIAVKKGKKKPRYIVPELAEILDTTYGSPIYQEQLMDIVHKCAGFSLEDADNIRRYMSKKKVDKFLAYKPRFVDSLVERGADRNDAEEYWDSLQDFSRYGFNKSHAAVYAVVSYMTAWLSYHYPCEYMCAMLNHMDTSKKDRSGERKLSMLLTECRNKGIRVLPPDINASSVDFDDDGKFIRYGLSSIKGFKEERATSIIKERNENGFYPSFQEFVIRVLPSLSDLNTLVLAGAFDSFGTSRSAYIPILSDCSDFSDSLKKLRKKLEGAYSSGKKDGDKGVDDVKAAITRKEHAVRALEFIEPEVDDREFLLDGEKETLSGYITAHPMDAYEHIYMDRTMKHVKDLSPGEYKFAGMVARLKIYDDSESAYFSIEDTSGSIKVKCYRDAYRRYRKFLYEGNVIGVRARIRPGTKEGADSLEAVVESIFQCGLKMNPVMICVKDEEEIESLMPYIMEYETPKGRPLIFYILQKSGERYCRMRKTDICISENVVNLSESCEYVRVLNYGKGYY